MTSLICPRAVVAMAAVLAIAALPLPTSAGEVDELEPEAITKYLDPLPIPGPMPMSGPNRYDIGMYEVVQQLHAQLPPTRVWGYGTSAATAGYPAATIEAVRGVPIEVRWTNNLPMTHLLAEAIDPTLHMAEWKVGVPAVVHLHGGEVAPGMDGGPDAWFTQGWAEKGPAWTSGNVHEVYAYPNDQLPATLWYHDHALGITRLNVYAGLAGFYLLRDPAIEGPLGLPSGPYEIPLVFQDRKFRTDGSLLYPTEADNPEIHPLWQPEFFGEFILVNGKVWPYLEVEPRRYRFRMLDGSNARFYSLQIVDQSTGAPGPGFWQIGSDGGYLDAPVLMADPASPRGPRLVMAPGERADVVVDFTGYAPGTTFLLRNNARSPFPRGEAPDPTEDGQVMQFRIVPLTSPDESAIRTPGPGYVERLDGATRVRTLTLDEMMGPNGPTMAMLDGKMWSDDRSETPTLGSTEIWRIVNRTGDAHPIHLHLTQFQLVSRQKFHARRYEHAMADGAGGAIDPTPYLIGRAVPPGAEEAGWKDTFRMLPGEVTTVIVRFAPQDGAAAYSFDATAEPGYVWHCHILEHEDNEMMRPYALVAPAVTRREIALESKAPGEALAQLALRIGTNPAVGTVPIEFSLPVAGAVAIDVFAVDGRRVRNVAAESFAAGTRTVAWDGRDAMGRSAPAGVYFVRMQHGAEIRTARFVLTR